MNNFGVASSPQFQMGQSNLPIRTAPVPPTSTIVNSNVVPQIMVTQDQDFSIFEGKHCRICIYVTKFVPTGLVSFGKKIIIFLILTNMIPLFKGQIISE